MLMRFLNLMCSSRICLTLNLMTLLMWTLMRIMLLNSQLQKSEKVNCLLLNNLEISHQIDNQLKNTGLNSLMMKKTMITKHQLMNISLWEKKILKDLMMHCLLWHSHLKQLVQHQLSLQTVKKIKDFYNSILMHKVSVQLKMKHPNQLLSWVYWRALWKFLSVKVKINSHSY